MRINSFSRLHSRPQIVFTDPRNKAIFTSDDLGRSFQRQMLTFTPSELIFYDSDKRTFLIFDKEDAERKVSHNQLSHILCDGRQVRVN